MDDIKERAALSSVIASAVLALGKFVAAFMTGSLGLLSDALHALLDVGATIMTYFAVRVSGKPADDEHHYGHRKIEAVAALIETGLLFLVAIYVAIEAAGRLRTSHTELEPSLIAYAVLCVSIVVDVARSRSLMIIAKRTGSEALAADALHFSSDLVSSALVLAGLIVAQYGYPQGDTVAAIGVALFISIAGYKLGKRTIDTLMDTVPSGLASNVRRIANDVSGVVAVNAVRLRPDGMTFFAEIEIGVARTLPLDRVEAIKEDVVAALAKDLTNAQITVTPTPQALSDETVLERVMHVARLMRHPVHHVTVQHIGERLSVSLDLEVDGRMPLRQGHAIADQMEEAIKAELGADVEVETHIEPLDVQGLHGHDASPALAERIREALAAHAAEAGVAQNVHDVRVRQTPEGLVVNYHCHVDPELSIAVIHGHVDDIEHGIRKDIPDIVRVVGHAEPKLRSGSARTSAAE
ncbi:MAG: cation diffusion facilitator family transporter [Alphaproteobacteria bacterium]